MSASLQLPGGLLTLNPQPEIARYYNLAGTIYASTAQVLSEIVPAARYVGQTFLIGNTEYWFNPNTLDASLIKKVSDSTNVLTEVITDGDITHAPSGNAVFDALALKVSNIVSGTNISVNSFDPQNPIISAIPATSAGIFDRVYFTGQVASVATPVGPNYDTIRNGKGSVASVTLTSPPIAASTKVFFTNDMIGPAQVVAGSLPMGNFTSFLSVLPSAIAALKRFTIEVFLCDNAGVIIPQAGPPSTDPAVFYAGKNTVVILDSGDLTLPSSNTTIGLTGYLATQINVAVGQRFRYHISVARGAGGGAQTMNVNIGSTWNSYIEAPVPLTTSTVLNVSLVPGATATDALNALLATSHNPVTIGTANGLSLAVQVLSLALASTSTTGALSSTDWNTFNNKQNALTNPITGTGTINTVPKFTPNGTTLGDSNITDTGALVTIESNTRFNGTNILQGTTNSDTPVFGVNLLTTGSGTNWTGASYAAGYTHTIGSTVPLTSVFLPSANTNYRVTTTITGRTAGSLVINLGGVTSAPTSIIATATHYIKTTSTAALLITPTSDFDGTVVVTVGTIIASTSLVDFRTSANASIQQIRYSGNSIYYGTAVGQFSSGGGCTIFSSGATTAYQMVNSSDITAFGSNLLAAITNDSIITAFGRSIFLNFKTSTGANCYNIGIGYNIANALTTGILNTFIGNSMALVATGASNNLGIGYHTFSNLTTGNNNTALAGGGANAGALHNNTTGSSNVAIANSSGKFIADGVTPNTITNNSIYIGQDTRALADNQTNQIVIGHQAIGQGSNSVQLGNSAITKFGHYGQRFILSVPPTSAGTYDFTTRNSITGAEEIVSSSSIALDSNVVHIAGVETITGAKTFQATATFRGVDVEAWVTIEGASGKVFFNKTGTGSVSLRWTNIQAGPNGAYVQELQTKNGTVALLEDITTSDANVVHKAGAETITGVKTWNMPVDSGAIAINLPHSVAVSPDAVAVALNGSDGIGDGKIGAMFVTMAGSNNVGLNIAPAVGATGNVGYLYVKPTGQFGNSYLELWENGGLQPLFKVDDLGTLTGINGNFSEDVMGLNGIFNDTLSAGVITSFSDITAQGNLFGNNLFGNDSAPMFIRPQTGQPLDLQTEGVTRLQITSPDGHVLIGSTTDSNPAYILQVYGSAYVSNTLFATGVNSTSIYGTTVQGDYVNAVEQLNCSTYGTMNDGDIMSFRTFEASSSFNFYNDGVIRAKITPAGTIEAKKFLIYEFLQVDGDQTTMIESQLSPVNPGLGVMVKSVVEDGGNNTYGMSFWTKESYLFPQAEKMRIAGNGNIGIGTPTPGFKLDVNGTVSFQGSLNHKGFAYTKVLETGYDGLNDTLKIYVPGAGAGDATPKMTFLTNGNVGVGVINPIATFHVGGTSYMGGHTTLDGTVSVFNTMTVEATVKCASISAFEDEADFYIGAGPVFGDMIFTTSSQERMRLQWDGGLYVTTKGTSTQKAFRVLGNASSRPNIQTMFNNATICLNSGVRTLLFCQDPNDGFAHLQCSDDTGAAAANLYINAFGGATTIGPGGAVLALQVNGNLQYSGTLVNASDRRLKKNIKPLENSLDKVLRTQGVSFDRADNDAVNQIGFIAQDLEKEFPELVVTEDTEEGLKSVNYVAMVAVLVEAMKEQQLQMARMQLEIDLLRTGK